MYNFIIIFNKIMLFLFLTLYSYQIFYAIIGVLKKSKNFKTDVKNRYAVIISARNERVVIGQLLQSIKNQNYPSQLIDIFVVADNCSDDTAQIAREAGAIVYERNNKKLVGKGYALDYIFKIIMRDYKEKEYKGYFIFDADNILDNNYILEMNKVFNNGYKAITSYRNSKNFNSNWISAGYALWFLRESKYLNNSRMILNTSCTISGTGFLISHEIIKKNNGWKYHLLTEDLEFSMDIVLNNEKIGYCHKAKFYDEQPCTFKQSWNQRLRWSKGFYQVFKKDGWNLFINIFKNKSFSSFDMLMTIAPAMFISLLGLLVNFTVFIISILNKTDMLLLREATLSIIFTIFNYYLTLFAFGALTTITEWKEIRATAFEKILYTFTFPLFIATYIPIAIVALFKKVEWKPIEHTIIIENT